MSSERTTVAVFRIRGMDCAEEVATLKAEKTIKVGRFPWGAAILPKDKIPQ